MLYGFSELSCSPLYPKYLQFRHRVFNEQLGYHQSGYPVYSFEAFPSLRQQASWASGVEYDAYDQPKTLHLAYVTPSQADDPGYLPEFGGSIGGCLRIFPADGPYMVRDSVERGIWKNVDLLDKLPSGIAMYEGSRIAINPALPRQIRQRILNSLAYATIELGVRLGFESMIGIMTEKIWRSVYINHDVPVQYLSRPFKVDGGVPILIGIMPTNADVLADMQRNLATEFAHGHIAIAQIDEELLWAHREHVATGFKP